MLVITFADPKLGFSKSKIEPVMLQLESHNRSDINIDEVERGNTIIGGRHITEILWDPNPRVAWQRLRALFTIRYKHPKRMGPHCQQFRLIPHQITYFEWITPIILILYAQGYSYRTIAGRVSPSTTEKSGSFIQVYRTIRKHTTSDIDALHTKYRGHTRIGRLTLNREGNFDLWIDTHDEGIEQALVTLIGRICQQYSLCTFANT